MKCFDTLYGLLDEATSRGTPGFAVKTLWAPARPLLTGLEHFHGVPSVPNKHSEDIVGWVFESSSLSPFLESESVSMFASDTSFSSLTAPEKISSSSDSSSSVFHNKIVSGTFSALISIIQFALDYYRINRFCTLKLYKCSNK